MKQNHGKEALSFYWRHAARYKGYVTGLIIMLPITIFVDNFVPPLILANVLSRLAAGHFAAHDVWGSFGLQLTLFGLVEIFNGIINWRIVDSFDWKLEAKVQRDLAHEVFDAMLAQTADFHANHFAGSLVSQTTKLLSAYVRIADSIIFQISQLVFGIIFTILILAPRAPQYVLVLVAFTTFFLMTVFRISRPVRRLNAEHSANESRQTGFLADTITNVMAIKSFARRTHEVNRFAKATNATHDSLLKMMRAQRHQLNYFNLTTGSFSLLALLFAIISVVDFNANIATVFLIFNYTAFVISQLFQFSNNSLRAFNRAFGDASEMITILAEKPAVQDPAHPEPARIRYGNIEFKQVTFQHAGSADVLFEDFSLKIKHGEKVGLVGHSGSGKTTFTRLLLRFSDIQGGAILVDGQNIAHITQDDLHALIAYVPQEPLLFHRSIRENIGYGDPDADMSAIEGVAKLAHAAEFIETLPEGYDTLVGERGVKLSGGQRQRIAIARAMLKNAPILVLDEATSALDSESEVLIQDALWKLMEGRTAIAIAHRLSTIQKMDRIVVLDEGRIVEQGTHKELIRQNGTYAKLWAHQSGGFLEDQ